MPNMHISFILLIGVAVALFIVLGLAWVGRRVYAADDAEGLKLLEAAEMLFQHGKNEDAIGCFDAAIAKRITKKEVYFGRAFCLHNLGFYLDAIDDFDSAIKLAPDDCNYYFIRSLAKSAVGDVYGCMSDIDAAIRLASVDNPANAAYNEAAREQGHENAAQLFLKHRLFYLVNLDGHEREEQRYSDHPEMGLSRAARKRANAKRRERTV